MHVHIAPHCTLRSDSPSGDVVATAIAKRNSEMFRNADRWREYREFADVPALGIPDRGQFLLDVSDGHPAEPRSALRVAGTQSLCERVVGVCLK